MQFCSRIHVSLAAALLLAGCGSAPLTATARTAPASSTQAKSILAKTVSVDWLVNMMMTDHDFNQNGILDISKPKNWLTQPPAESSPGANLEFLIWQYKKKLFIDADTDKDNKVTRDELDKKLRSYDADGDGKMHSRGLIGAAKKEALGELDKLDKDYHLSILAAAFGSLFN